MTSALAIALWNLHFILFTKNKQIPSKKVYTFCFNFTPVLYPQFLFFLYNYSNYNNVIHQKVCSFDGSVTKTSLL